MIETPLEDEAWQDVNLGARFLKAWLTNPDEEIEIGDPAFDETFRLRGQVSARLREALRRPSMQESLRGLKSEFHSFEITEGSLEVTNRGNIRNTEPLIRLLHQALDYAITLDTLTGQQVAEPAQDEEVIFDSNKEQLLDEEAASEQTHPAQGDQVW